MGGGDIADDGTDSSTGAGEEVKVNIRCGNGSEFFVQVNLNSSLEEFKSVVAQKCEIPAQQQRLIYKGRIMKNDQTLSDFGLEDNQTVYLVRGFATAAPLDSTITSDAGIQITNAPSTTAVSNGGRPHRRPFFPEFVPNGNGLGNGSDFSGALPEMEQMEEELVQDHNMIREILDIPIAQNLMNNPETILNLVRNYPQMREIMDRSPELGHILNDPATLRQAMDAARNPEIMREMMRENDRAMSNIESSPEGFNMLRRMYENIQEPLLNAATLTRSNILNLRSNRLADQLEALAGRTERGNTINSHAPNTNPLPNPWASAGTGGLQNLSGSWIDPVDIDRTDLPGGLGFPDLDPMLGSMPDVTGFSQLMQNPVNSQCNTLSNPHYMDQRFLNVHRGRASEIGTQTSQEPSQNDGRTSGDNRRLDMVINLYYGHDTGGGINSSSRPQVPPEERYSTQLTQLQEMGFIDTGENIRALMATAGNVCAAVERLLGNLGV